MFTGVFAICDNLVLCALVCNNCFMVRIYSFFNVCFQTDWYASYLFLMICFVQMTIYFTVGNAVELKVIIIHVLQVEQ